MSEYEDKLESLERTLAAFMQRVEPVLLKKTSEKPSKNSNGFDLNNLLEMQKTIAASQSQIIKETSDAIFRAQESTRADIEKFELIKKNLKDEIMEAISFEEEELGDFDKGNGQGDTLGRVLKILESVDIGKVAAALGIKMKDYLKTETPSLPAKVELGPGVLSEIEKAVESEEEE